MASFVATFRLRGMRWTHKTYRRNGHKRHVYAARNSYEPIFSSKRLGREELIEHMIKQEAKWAPRSN